MKVKMSLIAKNVYVEKICTTERQILNFERDMPFKYNVRFSNTPFAIGKVNLENV